MGSHFYIWVLLVLVIKESNQHTLSRKTTSKVTGFQRGSVEQLPTWDLFSMRSSPYGEEFGSKALPLRAAVESVPDVTANTRRLPLRDSVEKRPAPDEPYDFDEELYLNLDFEQNSFKHQSPIKYVYLEQPNQYYFLNQQNVPSYNQLQQFHAIINDYSPPFRIDNNYQQLFANPRLRISRQARADVKKIVCYIDSSAIYRNDPLKFSSEHLDPFACTHLIYAFANIDPHTYQVTANDHYDTIQGGYLALTGMKTRNPDLKVLLSIGGPNKAASQRFSQLVTSAYRRRAFIKSLIPMIKQYGFDGVDLHWIYPGAEDLDGHSSDKEYFNFLLEELNEIFKLHNWILSISASASRFRIEDGYDPQKINNLVDFVNLQAFDFHNDREPIADHPAPLKARPQDDDLDIFNNVDYAVRFWLKKGLSRSKLIVGIPFFGRSFTLQSSNSSYIGAGIVGPGKEGYYTKKAGFLAYFEICDMILNEGWIKGEDDVGSPFISKGDQWIGYDDIYSIENKIKYIKNMKLGGAFAWATDLDDFRGLCGDKWPLLNTIRKSLGYEEMQPEHNPIKPYGTCDSEGLYSDRRDCSSYFICRGGFSYHLSCAHGVMFNPETGKCDFIDAHNCRPGQTIHIPNTRKTLDLMLRNNKLVDNGPKVVCYMTNWAFYRKGDGKFVPEHLDQRLCTHVVYAFASLDPESLLVKEFDPWVDLENNLYNRVTNLKDVEVLLSLGGWTDSSGDKYSKLVSDGSARRKFVVGIVGFLRKHNFRGLHLDWNYPVCWQSNCNKGPASDKPNFSKLVQELRREFDKQSPPLILAAAISGYKEVIDVAYDLPTLGNELDFISVMTYDYHGNWEKRTGNVSPLNARPGETYPQYTTKFTMDYLVKMGAPKSKLIVGIPFYGQTFTLAKAGNYNVGTASIGPGEPGEYTKQPGMLAYYEICNRIKNQNWQGGRDITGPYSYSRDQWVGYDDVESAFEKARFVKDNEYGGVVAWTIDLDDFNNRCCQGAFPLLRSINRGLGLSQDNPIYDCSKPLEPETPSPPEVTTSSEDLGSSSSEATTVTTTTTKRTTTPWWTPESTTQWTTTTEKRTKPPKQPTTTQSPWTSTIPPVSITNPEFGAAGKPEKCELGQYKPDKHNCNAYYRCILGELKKQYCAGGLHWNKDVGICDWPNNAKCQENLAEPIYKPTNRPTRPTTTTTTTERYKPTTFKPFTSATTKRPKPVTESCVNGLYYAHEECNSFYVCVNGHLVSQRCAPGLQWSVEEMMCDWSYKIKCTGRRKAFAENEKFTVSEGAISQPYSSCEAGSFAAYAGDCTQYLICLWGKYEPFVCAPGLHWNKERNICDWPDNAKCSEDTEGSEVEIPSEPFEPESPTDLDKPTKKPPTTTTTTTTTTESIPEEPLEEISGYYKIVCYFTNWAWYRKGHGKYVPEDIDENLCTHIVYGFAVLDYENLIIKAHDSWADFDNKFYERVVAYKKKGLKVSLAIGGWNDSQGDKYSRLVNNPNARARFIKHVIEFLEKYDFDGLDLDWEYPKCWQVDCKKGPDSDKPAFGSFVREIKAAFKPKKLLLSAAVSPSKTVIDAGYDVPTLAEALDWVAVMTYDYHGQWDKKTGHVAPMYLHPDDDVPFFNSNFTIHYWISEGVPSRKIVMGMPLYGQSFRLQNRKDNGLNAIAPGPGSAGEYTRAAGFLAYYEICDRIKNRGWTVVKDPYYRIGPYAFSGDEWVSFDDKDMIKHKSEYIRKMNLGGGMIWALDLDDFKNSCGQGRHPLLKTIRRVLGAPPEAGSQYETPEIPNEDQIEETGQEEHESDIVEPPHIITSKPEVTTAGTSAVDQASPYKVVCYFTNWAWYRQGNGKYLPSDIDPDLCTHIVYGFAVLNGDEYVIKPHDTWADFDNKFYEKVTAFKAKGIKVLIAIGGWNDSAGDKYSRLVNNPSARRKFIMHVMDFIEKHNFDGLDLDWEYPKCWQVDCNKGPESDKSAFAAFVQELRSAFDTKGWLLSAAVSPSRRVVDAGYDVPALSKYLDWIAVMCYDYHGQWDKVTGHVAPMYAHPEDIDVTFNTNFTIYYWMEKGADPKKLVLGMPMYGQSFSLADVNDHGLNAPTYGGGEAGDQTRARGFLSYYEICQNIKKRGWKVVRDRKGRMGPYAYLRDQWVSFDDRDMIRYKSEYIKALGLGGGMIWALDLDDFRDLCGCETYPLLKTINRVLRNYKTAEPACVLEDTSQFVDARPTKKPTTEKPWSYTTKLPPVMPTIIEPIEPSYGKPCGGNLFESHQSLCNAYYLCVHNRLELQYCPNGLYWAKDHCDWPENTECHPDHTTTESVTESINEIFTTSKPITIKPVKLPERPPATIPRDGYMVVCYFTNWAWYRQGDGKYLPNDIDTDLCTHINYGFAVLDSNTLTIKPHDSWADIDNNFYDRVVEFKKRGLKVLIALGGWNDSLGDKYSRLVNSPTARARFIRHVLDFIEKWNFDGLDLDWEYPKCWQVDCDKGPDSDKEAFAEFVQELRRAFDSKGLLLSSAVSPSKTVIDAGYDVVSLSKNFHFISIMAYDYHGQWDKKTGHVAPLYYYPGDDYDYFNTNFTVHYWIEKGADPKKLILGMPLYGQSFSLADASKHGLNAKSYGPGEAGEFTRAGGFLAFYEICDKVKRSSWTVVRDPQGRIGPYAYSGNQWVSYDDIQDIRRKSELVKEWGLGGGMIWALDLDDFRNRCGCGKSPLLRNLNNVLRNVPLDNQLVNCT